MMTTFVKHVLVFYHVGLKNLTVVCPKIMVETAVGLKAFCRCVCHVKRMMRVIVHEQRLAAEGEQPLYLSQPPIGEPNIVFVASNVNGIGLPQPTRSYSQGLGMHPQTCLLKPSPE